MTVVILTTTPTAPMTTTMTTITTTAQTVTTTATLQVGPGRRGA